MWRGKLSQMTIDQWEIWYIMILLYDSIIHLYYYWYSMMVIYYIMSIIIVIIEY